MQTKFRLSVRWLCFAVLLAAVVVRLAAQPGLRAHLASVAAPTQAAEDAPEPAQDGSWPTLCYEPPSHDAPDLPAVTIDNRSGLPLEPDALPEAALALDRAQEGPLVLIIHTHATEAYTGSPDFHSTDPEKSVVRVGQAIADALNARGIPAVHETSLIDLGNYNDAYPRMAGLAEDWLARYPSIQMVLDVHRDSLETDDGTQLALRADVDGEACAKLLLVMGSNGSGLEHPGCRIWPTPPTCRPCASSARPASCAICCCAPHAITSISRRGPCCWRSARPEIRSTRPCAARIFSRRCLPTVCSVRRDRKDLSEI